eukprot:2787697-Pyramimonas_sp.AAC.1
MLIQVEAKKEQAERVMSMLRTMGNVNMDSERPVVLEFGNGKVRCSDGQLSTHVKMEVLSETT